VTAVPLYDYRCEAGHAFEAMAPIAASDRAPCPCGADAVKVPSRISIGGLADPGRSMEQMPQTWRGTYEGNREYLGQLRREWGARQKLEEKHEELRGDRRPILAHEGRFHGAPLRAGDPVPAPSHAHSHGHSHTHTHTT
jgi:putative FmdB family regulatory protein